MSLEIYITGIRQYVDMVKETANKVSDIMEFRVFESINDIRSTTSIPLMQRPIFGSVSDKS